MKETLAPRSTVKYKKCQYPRRPADDYIFVCLTKSLAAQIACSVQQQISFGNTYEDDICLLVYSRISQCFWSVHTVGYCDFDLFFLKKTIICSCILDRYRDLKTEILDTCFLIFSLGIADFVFPVRTVQEVPSTTQQKILSSQNRSMQVFKNPEFYAAFCSFRKNAPEKSQTKKPFFTGDLDFFKHFFWLFLFLLDIFLKYSFRSNTRIKQLMC